MASEPAKIVTLSRQQNRMLSAVQKIYCERQAKQRSVIAAVAEEFGVSFSTLYKSES